jgi:hypothetical protein
MAKGKLTKDRQYHGQMETDKDSQYHCQRETDKRQTISWPKGNWQKTATIMAKAELTKDR